MKTKHVILGTVLALLTTFGVLFALQKEAAPNLPPGVLQEMWLPISENAGIALNFWDQQPGGATSGMATQGTLMIRSHGIWQKIYLSARPTGNFVPVK